MNGVRAFQVSEKAQVHYADDINQDVFTIAWKGRVFRVSSTYGEFVGLDRGYSSDYRMITASGEWRLQIHLGEGIYSVQDSTDATTYGEGWILIIWHGDGNVDIYHNSTLVTSGSVPYTDIVHGTTSAQIYPFENTNKWVGSGYCKAVGFWNRALDSNEIQDLVNGKIPANPVYYFSFEHGDTTDRSGNNHTVYIGSWLVNQPERVQNVAR